MGSGLCWAAGRGYHKANGNRHYEPSAAFGHMQVFLLEAATCSLFIQGIFLWGSLGRAAWALAVC